MQTNDTPMGSGAMFDRIAHRYDILNRVLSGGVDITWRKRAAAELNSITHPIAVLDLATGTGDVAFTVAHARAKRHLPVREIVGADPSANMLAIAEKKRNQHAHRGCCRFVVADAQALPFANGEFDAVTMAFGIRNVPDRLRALREMKRVTRPGGKIIILELTDPPGLLGAAAKVHVHQIVPRLGALLSGAREYRYLEKSIAAFPSAQTFAAQMSDVGLAVTTVAPLTFGVCHLFVARVPEDRA